MKALPSGIFTKIANIFYSPQILSAIREAIAPSVGLNLLDAPCGTGTLRSICDPCSYIGIDTDERRILAARTKTKNLNEFQVGDAAALNFPPGSFDRVLAAGLFHHVNDQLALNILAEFNRVLKPGGKLIIFEAIWPTKFYNLVGYAARKIDQGNYVRCSDYYEALFTRQFTVSSREHLYRLGLDYLLEVLTPNEKQVGIGAGYE